MILTAQAIERGVEDGRITIDPFDHASLNPNSYNFHLGKQLHVYTDEVLDPFKPRHTRVISIDEEEGYLLQPGELYLGYTQEVIGSDHVVPMIFARSSIARLGLFVQITAPLGDLGYIGQWTLQLTCVKPLRVYAGVPIGQVLFFEAQGEVDLYSGKYQHGRGPQASKLQSGLQGEQANDSDK